MAYINDALVRIYLLEKKEITAEVTEQLRRFLVVQQTVTPKQRERKRERGGGGEKTERENRSGYSVITTVAYYNFAVVKSK